MTNKNNEKALVSHFSRWTFYKYMILELFISCVITVAFGVYFDFNFITSLIFSMVMSLIIINTTFSRAYTMDCIKKDKQLIKQHLFEKLKHKQKES